MTIKVDLLPTEKKGFGLDPVLIFLLVIVLACVVLFYLYSAWLENDIAKKRDEVRTWDQKINDAKTDLPKITKMKEDNQRLRTQIDVIKNLSNDPVRYGNLLFELGQIVPNNVWLSSINIDTGTYSVTMAGTAQGDRPLETIAEFMRRLQNKSRYYKDAILSSTNQAGGGYTFQLEAHYDAMKSTKPWDQVQPGGAAGTIPSQPTTTTPTAPQPAATEAPPAASPSASGDASPSGAASPGASGSPEAAGSSPGASPAAAGSASPGASAAPSTP